MKKSSLLFLFMVVFIPVLWSQAYQVYEKQSGSWVPIQNGTVINRSCPRSTGSVDEFFAVRNISGTVRNVWVRKIKQYQVAQADNSFCWNGCMPPNEYLSRSSIAMKPDSLYQRQFEVHFIPGDVTGPSLIQYSFFDRDHLSDSAYFSIMYTTTTAIEDPGAIRFRVYAHPNPASGLVGFTGIPENFEGNLVITNILGQRMIEMPILSGASGTTLDMGGQPEGIFFYFLENEKSKGSAGKLVIRR